MLKLTNRFSLCTFAFLGLVILDVVVKGDIVILKVESSSALQSTSNRRMLDICALKKPIDKGNDNNVEFGLFDMENYDLCSAYAPTDPLPPKNSAFYLRFSHLNCAFTTLVGNVQPLMPGVVVVGSNGPIRLNSTIINLTVSYVFMPDMFASKLTKFIKETPNKSSIEMKMYQDTSRFDYSLILIWVIAVATVIVGSLWTKHEFKLNLAKEMNESSENTTNDVNNTTQAASEDTASPNNTNNNLIAKDKKSNDKAKSSSSDDNITTINIGWISILVVLVFVVGMLLLLYYFFDVMIYFIYIVYAIGATFAFYRVGCLVFEYVHLFSCKIPKNNLPYLKDNRIEIRKIFLFLIALTLSIVWFVYRKESFAWILQDIMSISLAANALSYYRLSSFKTIAIILTVFFIYDVFMVFVTPLFTKGTSIMEAVAFGGKDASDKVKALDWSNLQFGTKKDDDINRLPVVIIVPHLSPNKILCDYYYSYPYTLLGLGDILIPGLGVNYAIIFDLANSNKYFPYFIVNIFAYLIGLFFAFMGLLLMNTAQPALLYLCPVILIFSTVTALIRQELKSYWFGTSIKEMREINQFQIETNREASTVNNSTNNLTTRNDLLP